MPAAAVKQKRPRNGTRSRIELVAETLEGYARRGVFRAFSRDQARGDGKASFKLLWHRDRTFELIFDARRNTLRFPLVLPNVPANSEMYRNLKRFIKERHAAELPEHRRIDRSKALVSPYNRNGNISFTMRLQNGEDEYAVRKLIHLVHEIFLTFLLDGRYYEYMVENFDLDPDRV
jgi:hypothetical protein